MHGLPDFVDEAIPFRRALAFWYEDRVDLNPHFFNYPSFAIYLHLFAQWIFLSVGKLLGAYSGTADYLLAFVVDPSPMVILARLLGVAADLLTVAGAWVLGSRYGGLARVAGAAITATAPVLVRTSTGIFVDSIATAFTMWGMVYLLRYRDTDGLRHLLVATILLGFAIGTKYPATLALLPFALEAFLSRHRWHAIAAIATAGLAFLLTTPYAIADYPTFLADAASELSHVKTGHFGAFDQPAQSILAGELWANLGPAGLFCLLGALGLSLRSWPQWRPARPLLLYVAIVVAVLATARLSAERYAVQLVPFAAVLAGAFCQSLWSPTPWWRRLAAGTIAAFLIGWPAVQTVRAQLQQRTPSQIRARVWCDERIQPQAIILQEAYTIQPRGPFEHFGLLSGRVYLEASTRWRDRVRNVAVKRVARLPLVVSGDVALFVRDVSRRDEARIPVASPGALFSSAFYEPRLLGGVDYVLTSSAVRGRYERDPDMYPRQCAFYRLLDRYGVAVAEFAGTVAMRDPTIRVYAVGDSLKNAALARTRPLGHLWWLAGVRQGLRDSITRSLTAPVAGYDLPGALGGLREGVEQLYRDRVASFADPLASYFAGKASPVLALEISEASLLAWPGDEIAFRAFIAATSRIKPLAETRRDVEMMIDRLAGRGADARLLGAVYEQWEGVLRR